MGKQGGILEEWMKNMVGLIFTQSFHAVFLAFVVELIGNIQDYDTAYNSTSTTTAKSIMENFGANDTKLALVSMVAMLALLKMEKMIKDLFGLKDSKYGKGLQESFTGGVGKIAGAMDMAKRTGAAMKNKTEAKKKLRTASHDYTNAKEAYKEISSKSASEMGLSQEKYEEKKAAAKKEMEDKEKAQIKAQADFNLASQQAKTAVATDAASVAFSLGDSRMAAVVDRGLDSFMTSRNKNSVYGGTAKQLDDDIRETTMQRAKEKVRSKHPGLVETDPLFERELDAVLNDEKFKSEINKELKAKLEAKFDLELELPESNLRGIGNAVKQSWVQGMKDATTEGSTGRAYARQVRKNGINYKGTNIDNVDDI